MTGCRPLHSGRRASGAPDGRAAVQALRTSAGPQTRRGRRRCW
ncbi:hypothetical protein UO65_4480 [Actinokineospora spheciospongiae]|uniref:Uncharacterized protein n=1 Tax=Actinokineospora spheciospongiae TaxID=909613 RepID=W7J279_9PSEU|nr:hypothetical protein UO65_4480 [Actinokineospora spheciospongiae]